MIIFYEQTNKTAPIVSLASKTFDTVCSPNYIKPKNKCCNKFKKKGINCKRCPLTSCLKAVS